MGNEFLLFLRIKKLSKLPHIFRLNIQDRMFAIKKGDDEIKSRRQKKSLLTDVLRVLKTKKGLSGSLDRKDIDISEFGMIHRLPQMEIANPGKLKKGETKFGVLN